MYSFYKDNVFYICAVLGYEHIHEYAAEAGFTLCGVARARVLSEHLPRYEAGLAASGGEPLGYLVRRYERRFDPAALLEGAKTVVVCALAYPRVEYPTGFEGGKVASFAFLDPDYHVLIKDMLRGLAYRLHDNVRGMVSKMCCDTSPILEKAWAVEAGLGWQGRNSLLVNPEHGSFLLLGELILDAECDRYDEPFSGGGCGSCRACVAACPVGALGETADETRTLDTSRCISSRTFEYARLNPGARVEPVCGWIEGCDECQNVCPKNK